MQKTGEMNSTGLLYLIAKNSNWSPLMIVVLCSSDYPEDDGDDRYYHECMDDAAGIITAEETDGPNDDQNDCDNIK